ncbi:MAG: triphosphoribosyl-dephospho-CoA synthase [Promethearchaeota archaeon]
MPLEETNFSISIKSVDDLIRCISLASLLELAGYPKPGNVHRMKNFEKTRFEHYLIGIIAIQPNFRFFCEKIYQKSFKINDDYKSIELGLFFKNAAEEMIKWQSGGNVLLGHILILAPLAAAVAICLKEYQYKISDLKYFLSKIIDNSSVNDTLNLYEAIRLCNPGGLGKIEKYDITDENSVNEIINDNINLKKIFELSKEYDLISLEYSKCFSIILNEGLPYFLNVFRKYGDINIATVNTYLKLLSLNPDTLIIRKSGIEAALNISERASTILKSKGIASEKGLRLVLELDNELQEKEGKLNPGTTADLISGVIFCGLVSGLRF